MSVAVMLVAVAISTSFGTAEQALPAAIAPSPAPASPDAPLRIPYGATDDRFGDLYLPSSGRGPYPVVVLIHGGSWSQNRTLSESAPMAAALARDGVAVWNIEYRRVNGMGGWPTTLTDAYDAFMALTTVAQQQSGDRLDLGNVHLAGHSAGGQLAALVAGRYTHTMGRTEAPPIRIRSVTLLAAVLDLRLAATTGRDGFVRKLLGGTPEEVPGRYEFASPIGQIPLGVRISALHGDRDRVVAPEQSRRYITAAGRAGTTADLRILEGVGHGDFVDPASQAWAAARATILGNATARH
ncbi:acetyl esterase/lipase [Nocardia transvalensis]|uniref:Acetyl esterase/lipase n=1 Tax=Nocardia transvalensis TaxID=37333 RepID=A0A7W9UGR0_9NOCA|nr:alpha/beta hydrolase [Nocardia transvalensis]MBB5911940.1 acetyl esterase/lipase [Nocardia transvalensis]